MPDDVLQIRSETREGAEIVAPEGDVDLSRSPSLRQALREGGAEALDAALDKAMQIKPKGHDFVLDRTHTGPALARHMSVTGG